MRPRSRAVALSVSLVIAASGGTTTAAAASSPRPVREATVPAAVQDTGPAVADDENEPGADHGS
jgi:hypothetical protein